MTRRESGRIALIDAPEALTANERNEYPGVLAMLNHKTASANGNGVIGQEGTATYFTMTAGEQVYSLVDTSASTIDDAAGLSPIAEATEESEQPVSYRDIWALPEDSEDSEQEQPIASPEDVTETAEDGPGVNSEARSVFNTPGLLDQMIFPPQKFPKREFIVIPEDVIEIDASAKNGAAVWTRNHDRVGVDLNLTLGLGLHFNRRQFRRNIRAVKEHPKETLLVLAGIAATAFAFNFGIAKDFGGTTDNVDFGATTPPGHVHHRDPKPKCENPKEHAVISGSILLKSGSTGGGSGKYIDYKCVLPADPHHSK